MTKMTKRGVDSLRHFPRRSIWLLVGERIRARRVECGHPASHLADELGISPVSYESYESGRTQVPAVMLAQLSELLDVPVAWFFQDAPTPASEEDDSHAASDSPPTYRIATLEDRVEALADSFRKLDIEGQQHLLAIAAALCQGNAKERRN
jgi:transcriptional regulator with XRE-family HTH domain